MESIEAICNHYNVDVSGVCTTGTMFLIWHKAYMNTVYDDSNPNVIKINGKRLIANNPKFAMYPDSSNDNHIETALKWIFGYLTEKQLTK